MSKENMIYTLGFLVVLSPPLLAALIVLFNNVPDSVYDVGVLNYLRSSINVLISFVDFVVNIVKNFGSWLLGPFM